MKNSSNILTAGALAILSIGTPAALSGAIEGIQSDTREQAGDCLDNTRISDTIRCIQESKEIAFDQSIRRVIPNFQAKFEIFGISLEDGHLIDVLRTSFLKEAEDLVSLEVDQVTYALQSDFSWLLEKLRQESNT